MMRCHPFSPQNRICQAAHFADDVVQEFFHLELTGGLQTKHKGGSGAFRYQEETLTESMLGKLQAYFADVVLVETFDKRVEDGVGADWFWILDFGAELVPMLVQAKKAARAWDGDQNWSVAIDLNQKATLEKTAADWNVAAQYCFYAPSWDDRRHCFPFPRSAWMHLIATVDVNGSSVVAHDWDAVRHMTPFTCLCCCANRAGDAGDALNISREKFATRNTMPALLARAREAPSVKGIATFMLRATSE